ncbi:MAG TPA: hypothetical protein VH268_07430 [Solirubrobacterales bacterium]|nr:hypothetical protein [Solirubrobacterales bacterium]
MASVGLTEAAAKETGHEVKIGRQKISGEGAGTVYDDKDGIVKLVIDAKYPRERFGDHMPTNQLLCLAAHDDQRPQDQFAQPRSSVSFRASR